jgi:hypothetical protein
MKRIITLLFMSAAILQVRAQTKSLISESFENSATGWTVATTCSDNWGLTTAGASDGTHSATYGSYYSGCSGYLVSPTITISSYKASDSVYMTFDFYRQTSDPSSNDYMNVSIIAPDASSTFQGPFEIDRLYSGSPKTSSTGWVNYTGKWPVSSVIDANGQFKVVFEGVSAGNGDYMFLDNVKLDMGQKVSKTVNLTYVNPAGGEYLYWGEKYSVKWSSASTDNMSIKVISTDNASTIASGTGKMNDDSFSFSVPTTSKSSFKVVITDLATNDVFASNIFKVIQPLALTYPTGGETYFWGQSATITWTSSLMGTIDLYLKSSDGTTINSWKASSSDEHYTIVIPSTAKTSVYVDAIDETTGQEVATSPFTIAKPTINFLNPTAGQTYMNDVTMAIQWSSNGIADIKPDAKINLQLVDSTGGVVQAITPSAGISYSAGSYNWSVPRIFGTFMIQATFFDSAISQMLKYNSGKITLEHNTGLIENASERDMNVYPNPSNGAFTIQLKDAMTENGILTVYSVDGKQVMEQKVNKGDKFIHADLTNLSGVYTLYIKTNNAVMHSQIMLTSGR